ncbi:MAG: DUF368 domain-containing protein [Gammaproteobacteria bacterium]
MKQTRHYLSLSAKGFCMGTADVVPGVSGGTMAFILGIYTRLLDAIKSFDRTWVQAVITLDIRTAVTRPQFGFLLPLGVGIFAAVLFFTRVVPLPVLIINHPEEIYSLFFGLIAGSIVVLYVESGKASWRHYLSLAVGLAFGLIVFNLIPVDTPEASWFIFLSGILAICAMILPGISGSFILLILNKYSYIFHAIGHFQWQVIIPFGLGAVTGLVLASRVLSWLLHRFYKNSLFCIIGLLLASLSVIWPYQDRGYVVVNNKARLINSSLLFPSEINLDVITHLLTAMCGVVIVIGLDRMRVLVRADEV